MWLSVAIASEALQTLGHGAADGWPAGGAHKMEEARRTLQCLNASEAERRNGMKQWSEAMAKTWKGVCGRGWRSNPERNSGMQWR
jgi:hypothetical protein